MSGNVIQGVCFLPLRVVPTPRGDVLHVLRPGNPLLPDFRDGFGELYFSEVLPGCVKAWKRHTRQTQRFAVPVGRIGIALHDDRPLSSTRGALQVRELGRPDAYGLLLIPPMVWYGFRALGPHPALICNCADTPHDPAEGERRPPDDPRIPYRFE
ncbi:MAG: dTDP-4-dehydrorhamnose 3,5-epimerase [Desulfovibrio sp.]|jgi:dTDP-4-dehydrorhamnose 3,5-epimerase|nr:dTDP-4-dehydrorhamnose 3,5-epimerase [Desulfovibrio sp.]